MQQINQYDCFILAKDINSSIIKGMEGVILEKYSENAFLVEFVRSDGTNYEHENEAIFTIDSSFVAVVTYKQPFSKE